MAPNVKSKPIQLRPGVHFIKAIGHKLVVVTCKPSDAPDHDLEVVDAQAIKIPRRRVLGYVVREGLERGKGRYWDSEAAIGAEWSDGRNVYVSAFHVAQDARDTLRRNGIPCRIVTVVAKHKTKEHAK